MQSQNIIQMWFLMLKSLFFKQKFFKCIPKMIKMFWTSESMDDCFFSYSYRYVEYQYSSNIFSILSHLELISYIFTALFIVTKVFLKIQRDSTRTTTYHWRSRWLKRILQILLYRKKRRRHKDLIWIILKNISSFTLHFNIWYTIHFHSWMEISIFINEWGRSILNKR